MVLQDAHQECRHVLDLREVLWGASRVTAGALRLVEVVAQMVYMRAAMGDCNLARELIECFQGLCTGAGHSGHEHSLGQRRRPQHSHGDESITTHHTYTAWCEKRRSEKRRVLVMLIRCQGVRLTDSSGTFFRNVKHLCTAACDVGGITQPASPASGPLVQRLLGDDASLHQLVDASHSSHSRRERVGDL